MCQACMAYCGSLFDVVHNYCKQWCFEANVKSVPLKFFSKVGKVLAEWVLGGESPPILDSYCCYLGIEFSSDG